MKKIVALLCFFALNGVAIADGTDERLKVMESSFDRGDADADAVRKICTEQTHFLQQAVEQDKSSAQFLLGICYSSGIGVNKNKDKANDLLKKSLEQGNAYARSYFDYLIHSKWAKAGIGDVSGLKLAIVECLNDNAGNEKKCALGTSGIIPKGSVLQNYGLEKEPLTATEDHAQVTGSDEDARFVIKGTEFLGNCTMVSFPKIDSVSGNIKWRIVASSNNDDKSIEANKKCASFITGAEAYSK